MAETIEIGIIGMGWMGESHSRAYRQIEDRFGELGIRPRLDRLLPNSKRYGLLLTYRPS